MQQLTQEDFLHTELLDPFNFNVFVILMDIAKLPSIEIVPIYFPTSKVWEPESNQSSSPIVSFSFLLILQLRNSISQCNYILVIVKIFPN